MVAASLFNIKANTTIIYMYQFEVENFIDNLDDGKFVLIGFTKLNIKSKQIHQLPKEDLSIARTVYTRLSQKANLNDNKLDVGFRVYRLDESNMQDVYYKPQGRN